MKRYMLTAILAATLCAGCDDFTEVGLPASQLTSDAVFDDKVTATAAMVDIYAKLRDSGLLTGSPSGLSANLGLYADEFDFYGAQANTSIYFYNNAILPNTATVAEYWNTAYNQVYAANAVYHGVSRSAGLPAAVRDQLMGEALFVRALVHFYLFNLFGDIPYITATSYEQNRTARRMGAAQVFAQLKSDLEQSAALLPEAYPAAGRTRPNRFAARALMARVLLHNGEWAQAANEASAVLNRDDIYIWEPNLEKVFLKESTATIWQLMPAQAGANTLEARTFSFVSGPPPVMSLTESLVVAFDDADGRKASWIKPVTDGTATWYHPYKYREAGNTSATKEFSVVLRTAELYLVRAEARARQGDLVGAIQDLDFIRNNAGLPGTTAVTQQQVLQAILAERRLELFSELGHRFFDLKRFGQLDAVLGGKPGWNTTDRLLPIPEAELLRNPNLAPQNPGY